MKTVYLDNAATTQLDPEVLEAMIPYMQDYFGNPSSIHSYGRKTKDAIETARRTIAGLLNCEAKEICFTSGGTEADNLAIFDAVNAQGCKHIITSRIEHHAVLHSVEGYFCNSIKVHYVDLDEKGNVKLDHLEELLKNNQKAFVSLMHANNEIANLLDLHAVSKLCRAYGALFHSDTVQTMAHYPFDLEDLDIDYITGSAHKFHGPKGIGFLYHNKKNFLKPLILGGSQERNYRAGTENLYGIVGMSKAMEIACAEMEDHQKHVGELKSYLIEQLKKEVPGVKFNGESEGNSLYTVLNVKFPPNDNSSMMLFSLDLEGIAVSGGSACTSGSGKGSHVLEQLADQSEGPSIRFSFSRMNTKEELDFCMEKVLKCLPVSVLAR